VTDAALAQFVVQFNDRAARIPKDKFHALFLETFDNGLCTLDFTHTVFPVLMVGSALIARCGALSVSRQKW
jgi:cytochrome bd-type quinol oxidase subunit 1